jgi:hypothetical protein
VLQFTLAGFQLICIRNNLLLTRVFVLYHCSARRQNLCNKNINSFLFPKTGQTSHSVTAKTPVKTLVAPPSSSTISEGPTLRRTKGTPERCKLADAKAQANSSWLWSLAKLIVDLLGRSGALLRPRAATPPQCPFKHESWSSRETWITIGLPYIYAVEITLRCLRSS